MEVICSILAALFGIGFGIFMALQPEDAIAPHDQKQVIIRAGKEFPNSALFKKITFGCIIHQNSLRGTVRCDSLLYTTEKYNCHNCIIHQFAIVFNHFLDML